VSERLGKGCAGSGGTSRPTQWVATCGVAIDAASLSASSKVPQTVDSGRPRRRNWSPLRIDVVHLVDGSSYLWFRYPPAGAVPSSREMQGFPGRPTARRFPQHLRMALDVLAEAPGNSKRRHRQPKVLVCDTKPSQPCPTLQCSPCTCLIQTGRVLWVLAGRSAPVRGVPPYAGTQYPP